VILQNEIIVKNFQVSKISAYVVEVDGMCGSLGEKGSIALLTARLQSFFDLADTCKFYVLFAKL